MKRIRIRAGKASSLFGVVMGLIITGIGIFVIMPETRRSRVPWMGVFWTLFGVAFAGYELFNFFSRRGAVTGEIDVEEVGTTYADDTEGRLYQLERLRQKGLITQQEYEKKRAEILHHL